MIPSVLWHASRAEMDRPTLAGRTVGDNHNNSGLGLYCATAPDGYIARFGSTIFALTLIPEPRVMELTIRELAALGRSMAWSESGSTGSRAWFEELGRKWSEAFDVVALRESSGEIAQAIVLRDDAVVSCERFSAKEYLTQISTRELPSNR